MTKAEYMKKWRADNRERRMEYQRQWRLKHPDSRKGVYDPIYYQNNKDRLKENQRRYVTSHPEQQLERKRRWRKANPVIDRLHVHARRTKTTGVRIVKEQIHNWDSRICGICKKPLEDGFELDHTIPLSRGGLHKVTNLQLTHPYCNRVKHNKLPSEMGMVYA